jgi:hypothetical protein
VVAVKKTSCSGSVLLIVVFVLALTAALVAGMLQLTTEELLQVKNQKETARAFAVAEAGLHDAIAAIRQDISWNSGFSHKPFFEDAYSVSVSGVPPLLTIDSTGETSTGYRAVLRAEVRTGLTAPYPVRIESFRVNP